MKKLISYLCLIGMLVSILAGFSVGISAQSEPVEPISVWDGTVGTGFDGGKGTADDPYLISSGNALAYLASLANGHNSTGNMYFSLTCSIDLNNIAWTPIGNVYTGSTSNTNFFNGIFNGNGYCIKNLNVIHTDNSVTNGAYGLFGCLWNGQVYDLGIESGSVSATQPYIAGIAGVLQGSAKISNCYNKATVKKVLDDNNTTAGSMTQVGGIAGYTASATCSIENCINYGDVLVTTFATANNSGTGGIVGFAQFGTVSGCYNVGNVSGRAQISTGGIVGILHNVNVSNCASSGLVMGEHRESDGVVSFTLPTGYTLGRKFQAASTGTFTNVSAYLAKYDDYEDGKLIYNRLDAILATAAVGNTATGTVSTTVYETELVLPTAPAEDFLTATVRGSLWGAKLSGADMVLDESISMRYYAEIKGSNYGTKQMTFVMNEKCVTVTGVATENTDRNEYVFVYEDIAPQNMGDAIDAMLVLNGAEVTSKNGYTAVEYLKNVSASTESAALKTLVADMLEYGAAAQNYRNYKTDALVNVGNSGMSVYTPLTSESDKQLGESTSDIKLAAAGVNFASVNRLYYKVKAEDISGVSIKIGDKSYTEFEKSGNYYVVYTDAVAPTDFDTVHTVELQVNGATVQTLEYSVASYVYSMQNNTSNTNMATLAKALYNYGLSASAYAAEQ